MRRQEWRRLRRWRPQYYGLVAAVVVVANVIAFVVAYKFSIFRLLKFQFKSLFWSQTVKINLKKKTYISKTLIKNAYFFKVKFLIKV